MFVECAGTDADEASRKRPRDADELKRRGITIDIRAPRQHARFIERRGAILRRSMHTTEEQMLREGLTVQFDTLVANAFFAGNALTHVGGVTPYNVVFGRQPHMLPPLEIDDDDGAASAAVQPGAQPAAVVAAVPLLLAQQAERLNLADSSGASVRSPCNG